MSALNQGTARFARNVLAIALLAAAGSAHDFWIAPETFKPAPGSLLGVHLRVGEDGRGEEVQRDEARIRRFVAVSASGEKPLVGVDGSTPAGRVRLGEAGVVTLGYHSTPRELVLPAARFEAYLREEGLDEVLAERARLGEQEREGREHFERSSKSLVGVGGADGLGATLGLPYEFVVLGVSGGELELELRFEGRPMADTAVHFQSLTVEPSAEGEPASSAPPPAATVHRTDANGRVRAPAEGRWLITSVHMQRAEPDSGADWHSWWGSLTYER